MAPIRLASTSADDEPINTAKGRLDVPLIATVASWVLSPSSARKTVANVDRSRVRFMTRGCSKANRSRDDFYRGLAEINDCSAWEPSHNPSPSISNPAICSSRSGCITVDSQRPTKTPTKLEQINASAAPPNTSQGCPDCADSRSVASWVLSPSSAKKTVVKVVSRTVVKPGRGGVPESVITKDPLNG